MLHEFLQVPSPLQVTAHEQSFFIEFATQRRMFGHTSHATMQAHFHGLGFYITPVTAGAIRIQTLMTPTPVDATRVHVVLRVAFGVGGNRFKNALVRYIVLKQIRQEFERDIQIWTHKAYRETPILCANDGPIGQVRRWSRQFYGPAASSVA